MKAIRESIVHSYHHSFTINEFKLDYFDSPWHFHPEFELTYIASGTGTRFIGDSAESFEKGDLVLIGKNVPHYWRCNESFYEHKGKVAHSVVLQFESSLFFDHPLPEMDGIRMLLKESASGIRFRNDAIHARRMISLLSTSGMSRLILFYQLLQALSDDSERELLSISQESQLYHAKDNVVFQKVLNHIFDHIHEEVSLAVLCEKISMSPPAFCRYFKKRTKKTFTEYVNRIRIVKASQLLLESDSAVSQIGYECGFNTLSYFNRQFKKYKAMSPKAYRRSFINRNDYI